RLAALLGFALLGLGRDGVLPVSIAWSDCGERVAACFAANLLAVQVGRRAELFAAFGARNQDRVRHGVGLAWRLRGSECLGIDPGTGKISGEPRWMQGAKAKEAATCLWLRASRASSWRWRPTTSATIWRHWSATSAPPCRPPIFSLRTTIHRMGLAR